MTEEEFKKVMTKTVCFIVIALIILIVIGIFVFNKSGKTTSVFESEEELNNYKGKVQEVNSQEESGGEEVNPETSNENTGDTVGNETNVPQENTTEQNPVQEENPEVNENTTVSENAQ